MNRKLIRTTLAEVKEKGRDVGNNAAYKERPKNGDVNRVGNGNSGNAAVASATTAPHGHAQPSAAQSSGASSSPQNQQQQQRKRSPPPVETNAEIYYYKKQMDAHTLMVLVLVDGEEIEGTIEWYDRNAYKINRKSAPNLLVLKHNVKYMYKAEDRDAAQE